MREGGNPEREQSKMRACINTDGGRPQNRTRTGVSGDTHRLGGVSVSRGLGSEKKRLGFIAFFGRKVGKTSMFYS